MASFDVRDLNVHNRGAVLVIISIIFNSLALALVAMRLATRMAVKCQLGPDDYAILLSLVFSVGLTASNCISVYFGYGKKWIDLPQPNVHIALEGFWAIQLIYKVAINLTKASILLLYLRIFPKKSFRKFVHGMLVFVVGYAVASIVATIFQCTPIARTFDHTIPGTCINLTAFWYSNAAANILGDFIILALPIRELISLHLPLRQRLGLIAVFLLGGFVCVTSILRMTTLESGSKASDQTYGTLVSTVWTTIEANTGIICACLPMLKNPLAHIFPRIFSRSTQEHHSRIAGGIHPNRASPADFDSWGRFGGKITPTHKTTISSPHGHRSSDEEILGMSGIKKTTDISIEFEDYPQPGSSSTIDQDSMTIPHMGHEFS